MLKNFHQMIIAIIIIFSVALVINTSAQKQSTSIDDWKQVVPQKGKIIVKMPYATKENFTKEAIYPCATCLLRPEAYLALMQASAVASKEGLQLIMYDCYRPKALQVKMYNIVKNEDYVALPTKGSMHNKGLAVDISLANANGIELDMGTPFDEFTPKANYGYPKLSPTQKANRALLRKIMIDAGFSPYEKEWWHFNYRKVSYIAADTVWKCN
jgi:zinc D-Ala-D-Ala dipeptidase